MATKITFKEAEELSKLYLSKGFVAFSEDLQNLYLDYSEFPEGPSKIYFYHEDYLSYLIERWEDGAEVTKYRTEPEKIREFCRGNNQEQIAAGTYGRPEKEYMKHADHEYVDLGLPSGMKWAKRFHFMGFSWGEVIKDKYSRAKKNVEKRSNATSIKADASMDAARYNWGGKWHMPTVADFKELIDHCTWRYRKYGYIITGPNGNSLFLPTFRPDYRVFPFWTSDSPLGEDKATALFLKEDGPKFCDASTGNQFEVWPVFHDSDEETKNVERIKIIKKGSVKIGGEQRMSYTISEDLVLTVKGNLKYGRDEYSLFPIKYEAYWPKHLMVADGVETIGRYLFYRQNYKSIKLPNSLKCIEAWAFASIYSLESISLPSQLRKIGVCAFLECFDLKEVTMSEGLEEIGAQAFYNCRSLENVILPEGLKTIGEEAFRGTGIKEIHIPKTVKYLSPNAFDKSTKVIEANEI